MPTVNTQFSLIVVSPDEVLFEGPATRLMAPGISQELAVLPDHTPLYSQLKAGQLTIFPVSGSQLTVPIDGGILRVKQNQASVITGFDVLAHGN